MSVRTPDPALFDDLRFRGLVKQLTDDSLAGVLAKTPLTLYAGFDPTSDSLHVGSLVPLLTLRRFQKAGHHVLALVGGATGMIGDPSGKTQERTLMDDAQLARNLKGITAAASRFVDLTGPNPARVVNNADWFRGMEYIAFLRDVGKHFTVNHMIAKESVRARLEDREHGISYTEFSYMLVQAYDFYHLNQAMGCRLQIGGSEQWGNITAGIELIRRMRAATGKAESSADTEVFGLTHPLVTKADGTKFGKTEQGTVWLDAAKTSPYQFYQFLVQTADADVGTMLRYMTFLSHDEILRLEESVRKEPEKRLAQTALARELTTLVHGEEETKKVEGAARALFSTEVRNLDEATLLSALAGAPSTRKPRSALQSGLALVDLLVETGLCSSKGAARKDIASGGIYVNNERVADAADSLKSEHLIARSYVLLRKGKKSYHLVKFE